MKLNYVWAAGLWCGSSCLLHVQDVAEALAAASCSEPAASFPRLLWGFSAGLIWLAASISVLEGLASDTRFIAWEINFSVLMPGLGGTGRCRHGWKWPVHVEEGKWHLRVLCSLLPLSVAPRSQRGQGGSTEVLLSALLSAVVQRK